MIKKHTTATERHNRNLKIKKEWDSHVGDRWRLTSQLASKYGLSNQSIINIIKDRQIIDTGRAELESDVVYLWNKLEHSRRRENRQKIDIIKRLTGAKREQIRYIIKNNFVV